MASIRTEISGGGGSSLEQMLPADVPVSVIDRMLQAKADVIEPLMEQKARTLLRGEYSRKDGHRTADALRRKEPKGSKATGNRILVITFEGRRRKTRNAEIAFVNEYGARGNPARAFINAAIAEGGEAAAEAAGDVYDAWLEKNT